MIYKTKHIIEKLYTYSCIENVIKKFLRKILISSISRLKLTQLNCTATCLGEEKISEKYPKR